PVFARIAAAYRQRWGIPLCAVEADGVPVYAAASFFAPADPGQIVPHLLDECLRWGEPSICAHPIGEQDRLLWAVPLMHNAAVHGGIVAAVAVDVLFPAGGGDATLDLRRACCHLRLLDTRHNATNAALLAERRRAYRCEQEKAYYLHDSKLSSQLSIQEAYLREEPALLSAIRRGHRAEATQILNRILVIIYHRGGERLDLIKSFVMELVAAMCRAAVEAGGAAQDLLGVNYTALSALGEVDTEEDLAAWLVAMCNRVFDVVATTTHRPVASVLQAGLGYMRAHHAEPLSRDDVAAMAGVSPSHFSRLLIERTGRSYTDTINQIRVDHAAQLLRRTALSILEIALTVGFNDHSYFTKVFKRHTGTTPCAYRRSEQRG
ncbi:MAG: helix-turn-helix transcriptional regulator, partial [Planctomycetota bacterium]